MSDDTTPAPKTLWVKYDQERWRPTRGELEDLVAAIDGAVSDDVECIVVPDAIETISQEDARGMLSRLISRALGVPVDG